MARPLSILKQKEKTGYTEFIIKNTSISTKLSENYNLDKITDIINGKGRLGSIIAGELDVDRMDYLIRDSYYTGVAYGVIDVDRIIANLKLDKYLVLDIKGVQAAESMLLARYFMHPSVYQHHTTRIVNAMFIRSLRLMVEKEDLNKQKLFLYDDNELITRCKNSSIDFTNKTMERIENRRLLKVLKTISLNRFIKPADVFKIDDKDLRKAEQDIANDYNLDKNYIFISLPEYPKFDEMKTQIVNGDELYHLNEVSYIVQALNKAKFDYPNIALYAPKEYDELLKKVEISNYLDLPEISEKTINKTHFDQCDLLEYM